MTKRKCQCSYCLAQIEKEFWAIINANFKPAELELLRAEEAMQNG